VFNASRSWKKSNHLKPYLLKHEQVHFDIAELYARKTRQAFLKYKLQHDKYAHTDNWLRIVYRENLRKMRRCERKYDRQTRHSRRKEMQQEWTTKILIQLNELKKFDLNPRSA
jgi:predicted secreted Zn-dependent protease